MGQSAGIGPEAPAGTGRGVDGGATVVGGAAAAASTASAGAAAAVIEHVGQAGGPSVAAAAGSGGPAEAGVAAGGAPSIDVGNPMETDEDKVGGGSTRSVSSQANGETVDARSTPGSEHELAESKPVKEGEGV